MTTGYEPRWDRDFIFGQQGELLVGSVLDQVAAGQVRVETKRSRFPDMKLFVECQQNAHNRGEWKNSGILVTDSEYWAFVKPGGVIVLVPVAALKDEVQRVHSLTGTYVGGGHYGDNPTRGILINLNHLVARGVDR